MKGPARLILRLSLVYQVADIRKSSESAIAPVVQESAMGLQQLGLPGQAIGLTTIYGPPGLAGLGLRC
jgi:hypothetical protein